ncbi:MAG: zinc ribbon domain-containing protein [Oscillospiraceae bacterium]|nr:zinc ribbon domain-containing protein [Oscillospiraceae bacterium]
MQFAVFDNEFGIMVNIADYDTDSHVQTKKATYKEIQAWVRDNYDGTCVTNLDISRTKKKCGLSQTEYKGHKASPTYYEPTIPDGMPRIIDDDLFERVQRRLEKNKHGGKGAAKLVSDAEIADYWLTGHIYCGLCGETMQGISGTSKRGDKFHYYSCKGHRKHVCSMKNQRKDLLEKIVLHVLNEVVQNPAIRLQIAEKCYTYYMRQNADSGVYEASIKSQLRETDAKIKNLLKAIEAGVLTETTAERMKALESTKHRLEDALIAEQNRQKYQLKLEDIVKWLESFVGDLSDMHTRKEILDDYIGKILVYEDKLVVTFKYLDKQQSFKYAETSAMIDNCQAILDLFERKEYSGHVSEEMLASVMDESENPYFF